MADEKTVEQLQTEIDKLKDKNTQLLGEKKRIKSELEESQSRLETVQAERDDLEGKYNYLTVELPREELLESVAVPGSAETLDRELAHHFDIKRDENGDDVLHRKDGDPVQIEGKPVPFTAEGIRSLWASGTLKSIGNLILGNQASGGGAPGSNPAKTESRPKKPSADSAQFGMR